MSYIRTQVCLGLIKIGEKEETHRELDHESVDDAAEDSDKVKHVPPVFEVTLNDNEVIMVIVVIFI